MHACLFVSVCACINFIDAALWRAQIEELSERERECSRTMQHDAAADEGVRDIGRCRRQLMLSAAAAAAAVFVCGFWHVDTGMRRLWQRLTESVASVGAAPAFFLPFPFNLPLA